ncbi:DUF6221 family protein [Rhodococcus erythropolis]|uniref:DUF6221 family protein n=1 Tax=Rhodococcus erythropolis TaxID=1833 RepID=UPI001BEBB806|nr:DUF6221 family protein [Rhodococcus erythropolis]MBT2266441.1 hypothetical protein [Rhodococcus erythropolis]
MAKIVKFLEARLAEDEAIALKAGGSEAEWLYRAEYDNETGNEVVWANSRSETERRGSSLPFVTYERYVTMDHEGCLPAVGEDDGTHIARHDPARILREVEAKRAIVKAYEDADIRAHDTYGGYEDILNGESNGLERALELLTAAYSDHPDFDPDWPL